MGYPVFILVEAAAIYGIHTWHRIMQATDGEKMLVNAVGCAPVWSAKTRCGRDSLAPLPG